MTGKRLFALIGIAIAAALAFSTPGSLAAELPPPPTLSTLASADDLVDQVEYYVEELEECVEDSDEYEDSVEKIERYSNTLTVVALAIGLHDQDCRLRKAAPVLIKASQQLANAKDYATAKSAVSGIKAALSASGNPTTLKWAKVADLHALMEQVPIINARLKRYMRRFEKGVPYIMGNSATLVAIAQGSMANVDETEAPDKVTEWYKYCIQMRDSAGALNKAVHVKDEDAAKTAWEALQQSCDDCHAVFHQDDHQPGMLVCVASLSPRRRAW